ncbi:MAG: MlaD family protein [Campylobacterota bacterium]|nr:MlaD family protein [Campylobacterota bacterium]
MDSKVNFTLVGAFLFTFILAILGFTFWLGKYGMESQKLDYYKVYLEESIAGLNIESSIKYKGLHVGVVKEININPNNSEQIEILLEVVGGTPIKKDTTAMLESQGITGLKYIDLVGGSKDAGILTSQNNEIPVIKSKQSFFGSLGDSTQDITQNVNILLIKLNKLFSQNNIDKISDVITNTDLLTSNINNTVLKAENILDRDVKKVINDFEQFTKQLNITLGKTDNLIDNDLKQTLEKVSGASDSTKIAFVEFGQLVKDGKLDLKDITSDSLKKFDILMLELGITMQDVQKMIDNLSDSPSDIIFKSRSDDFGPGEKNE